MLVTHFCVDETELVFLILGYFFQSLVVGGVTGLGLYLLLRYQAPSISTWTSAKPPNPDFVRVMLIVFVWISFFIIRGGYSLIGVPTSKYLITRQFCSNAHRSTGTTPTEVSYDIRI